MRLFTALLPPAHVLDGAAQLAEKVAELRAMDRAGRLRWADRANWHITLAFYGEVGDGQLDGLRERLSRAARRARPLRLRIAGGGQFGHTSLWAAVEGAHGGDGQDGEDGPHGGDREDGGDRGHGSADEGAGGTDGTDGPVRGEAAAEGLRRLAATTAAAGRRVGLGTDEPRRFRAHLTLARSRSSRLDLRPYTAALDAFAGEPWTAGELALVRSNLPEGGVQGEQPRYERIAAWPLGG
ncbi:RNA 2',3'-cyclic phosphodiesterase [Streptomyces sp. HNM0575]|uniref:2'-5' RNA ligase family protein n=1 Tax=Streptomyces sp. HNM0575 TaxID=2716338 RepID=UPI00145C76A7|nr:2'-5' RNA ligase family protein [Streptomyces sp. HNM0575]NLU74227.1 RNA 2',3'-cyclic phosphodiesterase [Streptomyces sp. HNM0575]